MLACLMTRGRVLAFALLLSLACDRGGDAARAVPEPGDPRPTDLPQLWVHAEGEGRARILLVATDGSIVREWHTAAELDAGTRDEVKRALDAIVRPSHPIELRVRTDASFATLKALLLAAGSEGARRNHVYVRSMAGFPPRIVAPRPASPRPP